MKDLIKEVIDYHEGNGKYNFSHLHWKVREDAMHDAWADIYDKLKEAVNNGQRQPD